MVELEVVVKSIPQAAVTGPPASLRRFVLPARMTSGHVYEDINKRPNLTEPQHDHDLLGLSPFTPTQ
jgi:hypothetical protein